VVSPQAEAVVDLDAYRHNVATLASLAPGAALMAVVKADAYGHGMVPVARAARDAGAPWLGVATLEEALALREAGDTGPLLCWLSSPGAAFGAAVEHDVELTASSSEQLAEILADVPDGRRPRVQLKVDTGLARNGAFGPQWDALVADAATAQASGRLEVTGVWSHLACADEPEHPANDDQEQVFREAVAALEDAGVEPRWRHLANSAALLTRPSAHLDLVRPGIATYGVAPAPALAGLADLRPVMTLRGRLAAVKRVPAGTSVSYGHTWTTPRETTLGLVPLGYGDGVLRTASGRAEAGYDGGRVPVVGRICMDQLVVDLGDRDARRGDVVTLFGDEPGAPTAQDWGEAAGTIGYEVVTRLGGRIVRTHRG
jgi:alanine racemase